MKNKPLENIFSVKNEDIHKILTILWIKIKFKSRKQELEKLKKELENERSLKHSLENKISQIQKQENHIEKAIEPIKTINNNLTSTIKIEKCPLCKNENYYLTRKFDINYIISEYIELYNFNPIDIVYKDIILEKRECTNCHLQYYNYQLPDSPEFYEALQERHFDYYPETKWDYDIAINIIKNYKPQNVLDIGCGYGYFLEKIKHAVPNILGAEFNQKAINICKSKNINVTTHKLNQIIEKFDLICAFQVLEHVHAPDEFIKECYSLLNDNGLILFCNPNPQGAWISSKPGILNLPPHHSLDIQKKCYEFIAQNYNFEICDYRQDNVDYGIYRLYLEGLYGRDFINYNESKIYEFYLNERTSLKGHNHMCLLKKH